jgi:hypothetical protein
MILGGVAGLVDDHVLDIFQRSRIQPGGGGVGQVADVRAHQVRMAVFQLALVFAVEVARQAIGGGVGQLTLASG